MKISNNAVVKAFAIGCCHFKWCFGSDLLQWSACRAGLRRLASLTNGTFNMMFGYMNEKWEEAPG